MKNYFEQFFQLWKQFGAGQRIMIFTCLMAIAAVMVGLVVWSKQPKMHLLYSQVDTSDLAEIVTYLDSQNIPYKIGSGGSAIFVPSDKVYSLRMNLAMQGVPKGGGVGFEIVDETNFGVSDFVQKTNYLRAIQGELARTISQLKGVRSARVMVSVPENRLLAQKSKIKPTASVFVDTGNFRLSEDSVNSVRHLVANSVEGLRVDDVAVVDSQGNVLSEALKGDGVLTGGTGQLRYRQNLEDYYANKIETMLAKVVGQGNVVARVSVKVNSDTSTIVEEKYDPNGQVVKSQTITEDSAVKDDSQPKHVAGATTGGSTEVTQGAQAVSSTRETGKKKVIAYEISKSKRETVKAPGAIEGISAAVFIAMRYKDDGTGQKKAEARTPGEIDGMQKMIANSLGVGDVKDIKKNITINEIPFAGENVIQESGTLGISGILDNTLKWGKDIGAVLLTLGMFFIFFRMVRNHKPSKGIAELLEKDAGSMGDARNVTPSVTADLINELVQKKSDNVGAALKSWMNNIEK